MVHRFGQSQVLSVVLLGGILIAGITATFVWGRPLLAQSQAESDTRDTLSDLRALDDGITDVAYNGGSRRIAMRLGNGALQVNEVNETISYGVIAPSSYISSTTWQPVDPRENMNGIQLVGLEDAYGIRGIDKPGVIIGKITRNGGRVVTQYKLVYRQLYDRSTGQTFQINIEQSGRSQVSNGQHAVIVQKDQDIVEPNAGVNGGPLRRITVSVRAS